MDGWLLARAWDADGLPKPLRARLPLEIERLVRADRANLGKRAALHRRWSS